MEAFIKSVTALLPRNRPANMVCVPSHAQNIDSSWKLQMNSACYRNIANSSRKRGHIIANELLRK